MTCPIKACAKCSVELSPDNTGTSSTGRGKPRYISRYCKDCLLAINREQQVRWKANNKEKLVQYFKNYHASHRETILTQKAVYNKENRDRINARQRIYHQNNKERIYTRNREWREANKERQLTYLAEYRIENGERLRAFDKTRATDPIRKKQMSASAKKRRARKKGAAVVENILIDMLIQRDGLICYLCSKVLVRNEATIDHVIPLSRNGDHSYTNTKVACMPCNNRKNGKLLSELRWYKGNAA